MYIFFCVYARHAGFVREVPKESQRDFSLMVLAVLHDLGIHLYVSFTYGKVQFKGVLHP